ncbi:MAG: S-methyl-5-thioribose-1-phosphate isomerase [Candidatus Micrarchaeaceae archaeon]
MSILSSISPIKWNDESNKIVWLDNSKIPWKEIYQSTNNLERLILAIKTLEIRGAPILGEAGAYGIAMIANNSQNSNDDILKNITSYGKMLAEARPTAVNLSWGVRKVQEEIKHAINNGNTPSKVKELAIEYAKKLQEENITATLKIGENGKHLIKDGDVLVTICNAGTLACDGIGTSTAPMRVAFAEGIRFKVLVTYTAPLYQGARLTAWELHKDGIPVQVITDNMAGHLMREEKATAIWAGADRILGNTGKESGTVYNKIGTFGLALMAKSLSKEGIDIKMNVAAPTSTIDSISKVSDVKIEQRKSSEVETLFNSVRIVPENVPVLNPAFDRTPPNFISSIVTELGIAEFPYYISLPNLLSKEKA